MSFGLSQARADVYSILALAGLTKKIDRVTGQNDYNRVAFIGVGSVSKAAFSSSALRVEWTPEITVYLERPADMDKAIALIDATIDGVGTQLTQSWYKEGNCFVDHGYPLTVDSPTFLEAGIEIVFKPTFSWLEELT